VPLKWEKGFGKLTLWAQFKTPLKSLPKSFSVDLFQRTFKKRRGLISPREPQKGLLKRNLLPNSFVGVKTIPPGFSPA